MLSEKKAVVSLTKENIPLFYIFLSKPLIYNFVPDESNGINWGTVIDAGAHYGRKYPFSNIIWYPFIVKVQTAKLQTILAFFLHIIPSYMQDILLRLHGKKTR